MKKSFLTGLVILLPIALTITIIIFLIDVFTSPFETLVENLLLYTGIRWSPLLLTWTSQILILITIAVVLIGAGMLTRFLFMRSLIKMGDSILHHIPVINRIYKSLQEVVHNFFGKEETPYHKVVLVPFHSTGVCCIGFMTNETEEAQGSHYSVFVPATPNPTMGFLLMYPPEEVTFLDMSVEDALKMIISCGVIANDLKSSSANDTK